MCGDKSELYVTENATAAHFNDAFTRANHCIRGANELMALLLSPPPQNANIVLRTPKKKLWKAMTLIMILF